MKKIICLLTVFVLAFTVLSCGDEENSDVNNSYVKTESGQNVPMDDADNEEALVTGAVEQADNKQPGVNLQGETETIAEAQLSSAEKVKEVIEEDADMHNFDESEQELDFETEEKIAAFVEKMNEEIRRDEAGTERPKISVGAEGAKIVLVVKYPNLDNEAFGLLSLEELDALIDEHIGGIGMLKACQDREPAINSLEIELYSNSGELIYSKEYK